MTNNITSLECLVRHCRMFLFACNSIEAAINPIAREVNIFTLLHLTATMFITKDKKSDPRGGAFFRLLSPMRLEYVLDPVEDALDRKVGKITLRQFLRHKRNKLATHGDLAFESQFIDVQNVTHSKRAVRQFNEAFEELESCIPLLLKQLEKELAKRQAAT